MLVSALWLIATMLIFVIPSTENMAIENTPIHLGLFVVGALGLSWSIYAKLYQGFLKYLLVFLFAGVIFVICFFVFVLLTFRFGNPQIVLSF